MSDQTPQEPEGIMRKEPGAVWRWFLRAPIYMYRIGLGPVMGQRFCMIEHIGRTSGLPRYTALEVVGHDDESIDIAAAWGPKSDWYRNLQADPRLKVSSGRLKAAPATAAVIDQAGAEAVYAGYAEDHPKAAEALSKTAGLPLWDPPQMAARVPLVRLTLDAPGDVSSS